MNLIARFLALGCCFAASLATAAEYRGTRELLKSVGSDGAPQPRRTSLPDRALLGLQSLITGPAPTPSPEAHAFAAEVDAFKRSAAALPPQESAARWLALVDKARALGSDTARRDASEQSRFITLMQALPPPDAWDALARKIGERTPPPQGGDNFDRALVLLAQLLLADEEAQWRTLDEMQSATPSDSREGASDLAKLTQALTNISGDAARIVSGTVRQIAAAETNPASINSLELPDLVTLSNPTVARTLLERAFVLPRLWRVEIAGSETRRLAREVAVEKIHELPRPLWELAESLDATALFEAMEKKFSGRGNDADFDSYRFRTAAIYYVLGLIAANRPDDAAAAAVRLFKGPGDRSSFHVSYQPLDALDRAGHTAALYDFLAGLLRQHPDIRFWDEYISVAARLEKGEEALALVRATAERKDLEPKLRARMQGHLSNALLAIDQIDEGVALLRETVAAQLKELRSTVPAAPDGKRQRSSDRQREAWEDEVSASASAGEKLARLGVLLDRPEWRNEGLAAALDAATLLAGRGFSSAYTAGRVANLLFDQNRGPEAEALLHEHFRAAARAAAAAAKLASEGSYFSEYEIQQPLVNLVALYHRAGRADDVLALLATAPQWGVADLAEIVDDQLDISSALQEAHVPLGFAVATALADKGRAKEARRILDAAMDAKGGSDRTYELLIKLGGDDLLGRLDTLFRRDRFEERPLIWKAHLLRLRGELEQAEKTVRAAIAVDPSDGEQGPGDRMRAYAVLADVLEARGDREQAGAMREAVKAIRISEAGDRQFEAGLLSRGTRMYQEALTHFADAYCIQSRLALRLAELGRQAEAEAHYQRAYELMPESFGHLESHCFGCEGAFRGQRAQSVAERVFTRLAAANPEHAQVHYLFGYLREQQQRYADALPLYRKAVALDAEYLNAWKHLNELRERVALPIADRDAVALSLLRLDPQGRHVMPKLDQIRDLRGLWNVVAQAAELRALPVKELYPLAASKAALDKQAAAEAQQSGNGGHRRSIVRFSNDRRAAATATPAEMIARQDTVTALVEMMDRSTVPVRR